MLGRPRRPTGNRGTQSGIDLDGTVVAATGRVRSWPVDRLAGEGQARACWRRETDLLSRAEIDAQAPAAFPPKTDITIRGDCEWLLAESVHGSGLHVLVNARRPAVRFAAGNFAVLGDQSDIWQGRHVNVNGTFQMSHVVAPHLIRNGWGRIVISTPARRLVVDPQPPYGAQGRARTAMRISRPISPGPASPSMRCRGGLATLIPTDRRSEPRSAGRHHESGDRLVSPKLFDGKTGGRHIGRLRERQAAADEAAPVRMSPALRMTGIDGGNDDHGNP